MENRRIESDRSPKALKIISVFFDIAWYLSLLTVVISAVLLVVVNVTDFRVKFVHLPIEVDYRDAESAPDFGSIGETETLRVVGFSDLLVEAHDAPLQKYLLWIPTLLALGLLWIVTELRRFLRSVRRGTPFIPENAQTLRKIGYAVTLGAPALGILNFTYGMIFLSMVRFPGANIKVSMNVYPFVMFLGLVILVIAQVFDHGVKLQAEQDLTV